MAEFRVGVMKGEALLRYSFPSPHPFSSARVSRFWEELDVAVTRERDLSDRLTFLSPEKAGADLLELFHTKEHIEFVRRASVLGYGALDEGDTPAYQGIFDAASFTVGSTLACINRVLEGEIRRGFNPVGGLHHARPNASAGFCVFNDIGVGIRYLRKRGIQRILYVDIDVHHGDGVYYPFEEDPDVPSFDVHEDGRFLYPGTGTASERGRGRAAGLKVNVPLLPGSGDSELLAQIPALAGFAEEARPEFVLFQCGADGLEGDPLGGLTYSPEPHRRVARLLSDIADRSCGGRLVAMGGGGYSPDNCARAWGAVVKEMAQ